MNARNTACFQTRMALKKQMKRYLGKKTTRRVYSAAPLAGGLLALAVGAALRRRGVRGLMEDARNFESSIQDRIRHARNHRTHHENELVGDH